MPGALGMQIPLALSSLRAAATALAGVEDVLTLALCIRGRQSLWVLGHVDTLMACPPWAAFIAHVESVGALIPARAPFERLLEAGPAASLPTAAPTAAAGQKPVEEPSARPGKRSASQHERESHRDVVGGAKPPKPMHVERDGRGRGLTSAKRRPPEGDDHGGERNMGRKRPRAGTTEASPAGLPGQAPLVLDHRSSGTGQARAQGSQGGSRNSSHHAAKGAERPTSTQRAAPPPKVTAIANPMLSLRKPPAAPAPPGNGPKR